MASEIKSTQSTRRYVRVRGPFDGDHLDAPRTPVLIYDLNLGCGFVNFGERKLTGATLTLRIDLPREGPIMVNAEAVEGSGMGVARPFPSRHPSLRIAVERDRFRGMASRVKTPAKRQ